MRGNRKLTGALLLGALLTVALLSSCGGGGGGDAATASGPLTKAQFIKRAGPICQKVAEERETLIKQLPPGQVSGSRQQLEKALALVIFPLYGKVISELAELKPPSDQAAAKLIGQAEAILKQAEAHPGPLLTGNPFRQINGTAAKYGIKGCTF
jgi:hypothetical protein